MREGGYDIIVLADIHRVLLRPKNASLFCNVRHLSWSLGSLAALAACSGGGGGGSPTASGGGRVAQPTFPSAVTDTFTDSPDTSGYVVNFDSAKTWNGLSLAGQTVYARSGAMLQEDDATPTSVPGDAVSYSLSNFLSRFTGGNGADILIGRDVGGNVLDGGGGNDILWGRGGIDTLLGGAGNDVILVIGSDVASFNYVAGDLIIPAADLASRNSNLNLTDVLGLTLPMLNAITASEYVNGERIDGGNGNDDLIIFGNVDVSAASVSNVRLANFGNFVINSSLTLSPAQLATAGAATFTGRDAQSELVISGSGTADFTTVSDVRGMLMIMVESGVTLEVDRAQLSMLRQMGDTVRFVGDGAINFDADLGVGVLMNLIMSEDLTITEMGDALDGDERGGVIGSIAAIDTSGGLQVDNTLRAGALTDDDGVIAGSVMYQWLRGDVAIGGAMAETYELTAADANKDITLRVEYMDSIGKHRLTSAAVRTQDTVGSVLLDSTGGLKIGNTLTVGAVTDVDAVGGPMITGYQWFRNGTSLGAAAQAVAYQLTTGDANAEISVQVTYTDGFGSHTVLSGSVRMENTEGSVSINSLGLAVDNVLTAVVKDADGIIGTPTYAWVRIADNNTETNIGTGAATYTLQSDDIGNTIRVYAIYRDAFDMNVEQRVMSSVAVPTQRVDTEGRAILHTIVYTTAATFEELLDPDNPRNISRTFIIDDVPNTTGIGLADIGKKVKVRYTYEDDFGSQTAESDEFVLTSGINSANAFNIRGGNNLGDTVFARFIAPNLSVLSNITYQWFRGDAPIAGETDATYILTEADAGATLRVQFIFIHETSNQSFYIEKNINNNFAPTEAVGIYADDDMKALAKLGLFTGDDPATEAQPVLFDAVAGRHGHGVLSVYQSEALADSAARLVQTRFDISYIENAEALTADLNLPNNHIIFIHANNGDHDLDTIFANYPNAIFLQSAGNSLTPSSFLDGPKTRDVYEKWAAEGKVYFVGGQPPEGSIDISDFLSNRAGTTKDYYFLSPYRFTNLGGTSSSVQHTAAKIEAAFNAFNQFFDEDISLVETARILKGTASRFADPSDEWGLGVIDLRKLLVSDENGNLILSNGKTTLKPLAELRMQANLDPNTGLPLPPPQMPGEPAPPPGFSINPPVDESPTDDNPAPADNDFATPDFSSPANHYDDFI